MKPLTGITVIDLTRVLAGPYCTMLLADMGAEVIKIEDPSGGDDVRSFPPIAQGWSSYFLELNRSKKSVALDLKTAAGRDVLERLVSRADVLVENFRPGGLARLGFGYEAVRGINPRLIYCSISGYGQTGPRSHLSGYDPVIQAECGLMSITGFPEGAPTRSGVAITDFLAGLYANQGILLALLNRGQTGTGQHIDIALYDSMLSTLSMPVGIFESTHEVPQRHGNAHPSIAPYEVFEGHDGFIMVCAGNDRLWRSLCEAIHRPELANDPRFISNANRVDHRVELHRELQGVFTLFTVADLITRLEGALDSLRTRSIGRRRDRRSAGTGARHAADPRRPWARRVPRTGKPREDVRRIGSGAIRSAAAWGAHRIGAPVARLHREGNRSNHAADRARMSFE